MSRIGILGDLAGGGAATADPLLTGLAAYWKMDEASGTRADSIGSSTLTDNNTVGSANGLIGNCASMVQSAYEYLSLSGAQAEALVPIGHSWSVTGWVKHPNGFGAGSYVSGPMQWNINSGGYNQRFLVLLYAQPPTGGWGWYVNAELGSGGAYQIEPTVGGWIFIALTWDSVSQIATFQVNGSADQTFAAAARPDIGVPCPITFPHTAYYYTDHQVDECSMWSRVLSRAERDRVYNAGSGLSLV